MGNRTGPCSHAEWPRWWRYLSGWWPCWCCGPGNIWDLGTQRRWERRTKRWHGMALVALNGFILWDNHQQWDYIYILIAGYNTNNSWLLVFCHHLEKWWSSDQLGWWKSQYMENKIHVPNHQPETIDCCWHLNNINLTSNHFKAIKNVG